MRRIDERVAIRSTVRKIDRMIAEAAEVADPEMSYLAETSGFRGLMESIRTQLKEAARLMDADALMGVRFHTGRARQLAKAALLRVDEAASKVAETGGVAEPKPREYGDAAECRAELATRIGDDVKFKTGPLEMAIEDLAAACRRGDMDGAVRLVRRALAIAKDLYGYTVELNELAERAARA